MAMLAGVGERSLGNLEQVLAGRRRTGKAALSATVRRRSTIRWSGAALLWTLGEGP